MRWLRDMARGIRDNAAYDALRLVILGVLALIWPIINGALASLGKQPWYWLPNAVLVAVAIALFGYAVFLLKRSHPKASLAIDKRIALKRPQRPEGAEHRQNHGSVRDPQPIFIALDELKKLLNEGQRMLAKYQVDAPNPTFQEAQDYGGRALAAARQQVFALTANDLARFERPWDEAETLRAEANMVDHGFLQNGSPEMAIYRHLWSRVQRVKELIEVIVERSDKSGAPRLRIACDRNVDGCVVEARWGSERLPVKFFRIAVEAQSEEFIKNCTGFLRRVEKNGRQRWGGNNAQLTFAQGENPDALSKTVRHGIPEFLDVLAITKRNEIFPGTERRDWRFVPAVQEIFSKPGDYMLTVAIAGDGVRTHSCNLSGRRIGKRPP